MQLHKIKAIFSILFVLGLFGVLPGKAEATSPDVIGHVYSTYTGAPIPGIWVKWSDAVGGYWYAKTDNNGQFFFPSWQVMWNDMSDSERENYMNNTYIDSDLNGANDTRIAYEIDYVNSPYWDFSCGSDPHVYSAVHPVTLPSGSFTQIGPVNINNGNNTLDVGDIYFTPDIPPTPTPTPTPPDIYSVSGNVFVDRNQNGFKDNGEVNYSGTPNVTASRGVVTVGPGGYYTITKLTAGPLTVSFPGLPAGFSLINPLNGPPPSFQVTVGAGVCSTNGAKGASCQ